MDILFLAYVFLSVSVLGYKFIQYSIWRWQIRREIARRFGQVEPR